MRNSLKAPSLRSLNCTLSTGQSAGRNSSGRITVFHRGGGSKRLQRKIDLKRSTSSMGIVERIEYDPNRSSRIALVRWIEVFSWQRKCNTKTIEEFAPPRQILESTTATIFCCATFSFPRFQSKVACSQAKCLLTLFVVVGLPTFMPPWSTNACAGSKNKKTCAKDVFLSALPLVKGETAFLSFGSSLAFPRIAIAGAKPAFFAPRMREKLIGKQTFSLCEIRKRRTHCVLWAHTHRIKRQAAIAWQQQKKEHLWLVGAAEHNESKPKADNTYIVASHRLEAGQMVMNCDWSKPSQSGFFQECPRPHTYLRWRYLVRTANKDRVSGGSQLPTSWPRPPAYRYEILDFNSQGSVGNCIQLADIRMGTLVHDIEDHPGQGAKLARAAGTSAKIIKEPASKCLVRLPSGVEKLIDSRCRATIGIVSNPHHGARKLRKAGQSRWLGRRPIVRGVAMNPVDHPHGGGEGRTKGGRPSVSPWGKPTKAGFRAVVGVGKHIIE
nr:ribosomal protein L2 [Gastrodia javanica]